MITAEEIEDQAQAPEVYKKSLGRDLALEALCLGAHLTWFADGHERTLYMEDQKIKVLTGDDDEYCFPSPSPSCHAAWIRFGGRHRYEITGFDEKPTPLHPTLAVFMINSGYTIWAWDGKGSEGYLIGTRNGFDLSGPLRSCEYYAVRPRRAVDYRVNYGDKPGYETENLSCEVTP